MNTQPILIKCPACTKPVSINAETCPNCGERIDIFVEMQGGVEKLTENLTIAQKKSQKGCLIIIAVLALLMFSCSMLTDTSNGEMDGCLKKGETYHGWDKDIYHDCMGTPKPFRW